MHNATEKPQIIPIGKILGIDKIDIKYPADNINDFSLFISELFHGTISVNFARFALFFVVSIALFICSFILNLILDKAIYSWIHFREIKKFAAEHKIDIETFESKKRFVYLYRIYKEEGPNILQLYLSIIESGFISIFFSTINEAIGVDVKQFNSIEALNKIKNSPEFQSIELHFMRFFDDCLYYGFIDINEGKPQINDTFIKWIHTLIKKQIPQ